MTGSVTRIENPPTQEKDEKLFSIGEVKNSDTLQEDKLIDILDDNVLMQDTGTPAPAGKDTLGSAASVRVIDVKEAPVQNVDESSTAGVDPRRLSILTSPNEQVLTERTFVDGSVPSSSPKESVPDKDEVSDLGDESSQNIDDIMTLEEILNKELLNFSASGLCWQLSRDKKNVLSMFFVK